MENIDGNIFITIGLKMMNNEYKANNKIKYYDEVKINEIRINYINKLNKQINTITNDLKAIELNYNKIINDISNDKTMYYIIKKYLFHATKHNSLSLDKEKYTNIVLNNLLEEINNKEIILEKLKCLKMIAENNM